MTLLLSCLAFALSPADGAEGDGVADAALPGQGAEALGGGIEEDIDGEQMEQLRAMLAFEANLSYDHGDVILGDGKVVLHVPESFGYLDPAETDQVIQVWGNPASPDTWGMLVPSGVSIFADESYAVVVTYSDDGHVADDDAAEIDYTELLTQMKTDSAEGSKARVAAGLSPVTLIGWAEQPRYDASTHKMYWAKELDFGSGDRTLNYAIRALGRTGVLEFNAVAPLSQLANIKKPMEDVLGFAEFNSGHRYEDFDASTDHVAEYGLAALVAGGVAAKSGLFKGLFVLLMAGKKFVVIAAVAALGVIKSFFGKKDDAK